MEIRITLPRAWHELTQEQLRYLLQSIAHVTQLNADTPYASLDSYAASTAAQVATRCLMHWSGMKLVCPCADGYLIKYQNREITLPVDTIASAITHLDWAKHLPDHPVRLDTADGARALPADLSSGFSFDKWLACETLWQTYQAAPSDETLRLMAEILYQKDGITLTPAETLGIFYWWAAVKNMVSHMFPNFFRPVTHGTEATPPDLDDLRRSVDAQLRALTKGDITKEREILAMDAMRALTELDAQAHEYDTLRQKYPSS